MKHYFYNLITVLYIFGSLSACVPVQSTNSTNTPRTNYYPDLSFENKNYKERIKTVQLVHFKGSQMVSTNNTVIELGGNDRLLLTFDDINDQQQQYSAKIIHCNKDWTSKSNIQSMDYLEEFNQFPIREFEFSFDTKLGYIHYEWEVPRVKLSGNYLIVVFQDNDEENIILSERFMVHENKAGINYKISASDVVSKRRTHQELDFEVLLNNINVINAGTDIYPVIRQNNNWLYSKKAPEPLRITDGNKRLVYEFYNGELNFPGNNEFRFIDISTVNFKGNGVANINKETKPISITLRADGVRASEAYREWEDRNGTFAIGNRERPNTALVSDYFITEFKLNASQDFGDIYIVGEFNNWQLENVNRMKYNTNTGMYQNSLLLKQGYYEYNYYVENKDINAIDGSYFNTENTYDILIYYKNSQLRYDRLIGYTKFNSRAAQ
ncbi:type IX secretion system plug protein domain-containing protein [Marivirga tractuosa]|uniref:type IX secretion system plug protein n=1 Tax=Marivirga tractuosa TaxID=1006 RepID=UPI0035D139F9